MVFLSAHFCGNRVGLSHRYCAPDTEDQQDLSCGSVKKSGVKISFAKAPFHFLFRKQIFIADGKDFGKCFQFNVGDKSGAALDALDCVFVQLNAFQLHFFSQKPLGYCGVQCFAEAGDIAAGYIIFS